MSNRFEIHRFVLEATLSRATRLPGTRRFYMDKSDEARLLSPAVRAKQELQLGMLACEPAVHNILGKIDHLFDGSLEPGFVTMKTIVLSQPGHAETAAFIEAAETLRRWSATGRVMDGKRRRDALWALEALELSLMFQKAIVNSLAEHEGTREASLKLDDLIAAFETAIDHLLLEHLPYARRFAARNVEEGEDPEDVFQVAFTGLQRSTRRFDPKRGHRFVVYSTFWMRQAVTRWRADEGATIRIPVHRHEKVADLDRATERLEARHARDPTEAELVAELGWDREDVRSLLRIPRRRSDLDDLSLPSTTDWSLFATKQLSNTQKTEPSGFPFSRGFKSSMVVKRLPPSTLPDAMISPLISVMSWFPPRS